MSTPRPTAATFEFPYNREAADGQGISCVGRVALTVSQLCFLQNLPYFSVGGSTADFGYFAIDTKG